MYKLKGRQIFMATISMEKVFKVWTWWVWCWTEFLALPPKKSVNTNKMYYCLVSPLSLKWNQTENDKKKKLTLEQTRSNKERARAWRAEFTQRASCCSGVITFWSFIWTITHYRHLFWPKAASPPGYAQPFYLHQHTPPHTAIHYSTSSTVISLHH